MSAIPQEWIEAGARALIERMRGKGFVRLLDGEEIAAWCPPAEAVLAAALPLIREAIDRSVEAEIHHAADNGHMLDWRCQGVAPGEVVPAVRVDFIRAAITGAFRGLT